MKHLKKYNEQMDWESDVDKINDQINKLLTNIESFGSHYQKRVDDCVLYLYDTFDFSLTERIDGECTLQYELNSTYHELDINLLEDSMKRSFDRLVDDLNADIIMDLYIDGHDLGRFNYKEINDEDINGSSSTKNLFNEFIEKISDKEFLSQNGYSPTSKVGITIFIF